MVTLILAVNNQGIVHSKIVGDGTCNGAGLLVFVEEVAERTRSRVEVVVHGQRKDAHAECSKDDTGLILLAELLVALHVQVKHNSTGDFECESNGETRADQPD
ncbi:unnamed protein product, partial [Dicrocoelium dendriticum]